MGYSCPMPFSLACPVHHELVIKKSRFIACVESVAGRDEAQTRVIEAQVRAEEARALANETQSHIDRLKRRSAEARARVEAALERLPSLSELAVSPEDDEPIQNSGSGATDAPTGLHSVTSSDFTNPPL